ncbi:MAG: N-acetyltransferase [Spirochaetales bacterium]|nr:N-acetyltransferase [Spirochaetales bacterium]
MDIREAVRADAPAFAAIYNHYIATSVFTFDEKPCTEGFFEAKLERLSGQYPFLCAGEDGRIIGYAYASPFREKPAYRHTAETSVYLDYHYAGRGLGSLLYAALLDRLKSDGFKTAVAVLGLPNPASEKLHERFGFTNAGTLRQVGHKFGRWLDTGYWQLDLEKYGK